MTNTLEVVDRKTNEVVHRLNVAGKSDRTIDRIEAGMSINMDPRYFIRRSVKTIDQLAGT